VEGRGREGESRSENVGQTQTRMLFYFVLLLKEANNSSKPGLNSQRICRIFCCVPTYVQLHAKHVDSVPFDLNL
jgi:hypothetical protein